MRGVGRLRKTKGWGRNQGFNVLGKNYPLDKAMKRNLAASKPQVAI